MAGSILKKLRGVRVKMWADLKICLHRQGLRVKYSKTQGLFIKFSRPKGYVSIWALGSGSNGSDLKG